jgi:hypothetical protein
VKRFIFLLIFGQVLFTSFSGAATLECRTVYGEFRKSLTIAQTSTTYSYLKSTLSSLDSLRGDNGLVKDTNWVIMRNGQREQIKSLNSNTSNTNVAIDLLIQTELISRRIQPAKAKKHLNRILNTLTRAPRHRDSGLFYSWYTTGKKTQVASHDLSSIDNLHIALALWTIKETFPNSKFAVKAEEIFNSMDFSIFYDEASGLIGGNFSYQKQSGTWIRDAYNFSHSGSEARSLYSAGWALGLFRKYNQDPKFAEKAINALTFEIAKTPHGDILKLWDGSAFQLLFPKIFVGEDFYSPKMKQMYLSLGEFMISEGKARGLDVPAAHSPGVAEIVHDNPDKPRAIYNDKEGNKTLVSELNEDLKDPEMNARWDRTFAPYALFMAATANPARFIPIIESTKKFKSGDDAFHIESLGWMDGLNLTKDRENEVVPAQLAVNQGMIALSALHMLSKDGHSASSRALKKNAATNSRLLYFYLLFDQALKAH